ncbi:uncharacterized protein N0V89_002129 [Didymosphaeria variabile]|uniref:Uncharacterized protein n=1 Tax=Didymosphaeria variabile TaxID=1932322 RepID=A0A9W8XSX4_9PLEO|nr:uncharacterized protein N0V89_002129 [Didymosphaeria variabile]KAJ4357553.1 hypothetical protein N0V89_002129 [Didymosphaeria variabile]
MPDMLYKKEIGDTKDVLQDIVVVVTLITTLAKSFGSAGNLYRKLKKKTKNTKKGLKEDIKQEIEEHLPEPERPRQGDARSEEARHDRRWRSRSRHRREESCDSGKESIEHAYELVRAEYDRGYHRIGEKYAVGDLITRNQLQAQIIALQQRLLYTYEDIILDPEFSRHPPSYHLKELVHTTRAARVAVIDALVMQSQRMLPSPIPTHTARLLPEDFPTSPIVHQPHDVVLHEHQTKLVKHIDHRSASRSPIRNTKESPDLYCLYARNLQRNSSLPLADTFKSGGNGCCPYCHEHISTNPTKAWEIPKEDEQRKGGHRTFLIGMRFLVKCHRMGGGFACMLCSRWKEADTVCGEVRALVEHLWKEHSCVELEGDENIGEER